MSIFSTVAKLFFINFMKNVLQCDKLCVADVTYFLEKNWINLTITFFNFETAMYICLNMKP